MSNDSISSVSTTSSLNSLSSASTANQPLTAATKAKLDALGVDTTSIKTETQGQVALSAAQTKQEAQKSAHSHQGGNSSMESIKNEAKSLASQVGVSVSDEDKVDDILSKVASKISELQVAAGTDETKLAQVQQYQSQYDSISSSLSNMQAAKAQLSSSMDNMASYNKMAHGLN